MKKLKYLLVMTILLVPISGKAAMHCSAPSSVESGETFGVTFHGSIGGSAPIWFAKLAGEGNVSYSSGNLTVAGEEVSDFSRTVYYTAGNPGSAKFYAYDVDVASDNDSFSSSDTCTVTITEATRPNGVSANIYDIANNNDNTEVDPDKSANNNLKSLSIDGIKISPAFNKEKLEYVGVVTGDKEKINIKGEAEDSTATVDGLGEKELKEGINKIEIVVTAENGQQKKYVITITRKEKNPIEVTINKKKYTVLKKDINLKVPEGFTKTSLVIDKQDVEAYSNSFTGYLLVALVDEDGNAGWFIYNQKNGTYTKYSEFKSSGLRLIILEAKKKDVPYKYKKYKVDIDGVIVDGYALEYGSEYRLVYALNMDTGDTSFYLYDMKENTFQRFYNKQVEIYRGLLKKLEIVIIGLGSVIGIMFIIILCQAAINRKTKKFIKSGGKVEEKKPVIEDEDLDDEKEEERNVLKNRIREKAKRIEEEKEYKAIEVPDTVEEAKESEDEEEPLSREEIKRRKREEKEEMEQARREFFDL